MKYIHKSISNIQGQEKSYVSVWNYIPRFGYSEIYKSKRLSTFNIDETIIQIGNQHFWLWFCIEPIHVLYLESTFMKI